MSKNLKCRGLDVYEADLRFRQGEKVSENEWDRKILPMKAKEYVEEYDIEIDQRKIIPEDKQLKKDIFEAAIAMFTDMGYFNMDREKVMEVNEDEIHEGLKKAPTELTIGAGNDAVWMYNRGGNPSRPPLIQGGPTGAPVSEDLFVKMHQTYAQEPRIDTIVDGVPNSVRGEETPAGSPWEIKGTLFELRSIREACIRAGRPEMGI
ncbi:Monomethylamine methyltransferase MtmB [Methanonatronarchaeum thermophilum]|uniref:[methylamine--corrinoid protein] Co-methyltransferase n=1 Tax=Methanonatronarchaeum thermophilum TaxID=1927129 RepID=A0A1Y3GBL5_9EURY|nr:Monomethylamine methyltransferase MtmB [Methanonatronarchaeum thermophilum]